MASECALKIGLICQGKPTKSGSNIPYIDGYSSDTIKYAGFTVRGRRFTNTASGPDSRYAQSNGTRSAYGRRQLPDAVYTCLRVTVFGTSPFETGSGRASQPPGTRREDF